MCVCVGGVALCSVLTWFFDCGKRLASLRRALGHIGATWAAPRPVLEMCAFRIEIANHQFTVGDAGVDSPISFWGKLGAIRPTTCSVMFGAVWAQQASQIDSIVNRDYEKCDA